MKRHHALAAAALAVLALQARAADPVAGAATGTWINPLPAAPGIVTTGVGTPTFTWGDSTGYSEGDNTLSFAGVAFASVTETPFKVGTISYHNGTTLLGTTPDSVQLSLDLNFGTPALGHIVSNYSFGLITTPNTSDPDESADFVSLPSGFSTTSFLIGSTTYNVKLTGFQNIVGDGFIASNASEFHVREGLSASADVYAVVTTQVAAVPEPQTYALMAAGLVVVGFVARRRQPAAGRRD